jgi:hypothetical protein
MDVKPEGYAVDKKYPDIIYVPEDARFDLHKQKVSWPGAGGHDQIASRQNLRAAVRLQSAHGKAARPQPAWRLVGTAAEGTLCHKPSTVSGGGKSEISKPITDAILTGPVFVADFKNDFDRVAELLDRDYSGPFQRINARKRISVRMLARSGRSARSSNCSRRTSAITLRNTMRGWKVCRNMSRNSSLW